MKVAELNLREQANARQWPNRRFLAADFPEMRDDPGARRVWITATKWVPYEMVEVCTMAEERPAQAESFGPYFCELCGATGLADMDEHRAKYHRPEGHRCTHPACGFVASAGAGLAAHVRAKHGGGNG